MFEHYHKMTPEEIAECCVQLSTIENDFNRDRSKSATASFAVINKAGEFHNMEDHGSCHSGLNMCKDGGKALVNGFQSKYFERSGDNEKYVDLFYNYLFNRSHYAECFIHPWKGNKTGHTKTNQYLRLDVPTNFLAGALISTRAAWEKPECMKSFYHFVKAGMEEHRAFMACYNFSGYNGRGDEIRYAPKSGHCPFVNSEKKTVLNYINGVTQSPRRSYYDGEDRYDGVDKLWQKGSRDLLFVDYFREVYESFGAEVEEGPSLNPWQETYDKFIEEKKAKDYGVTSFRTDDLDTFVKVMNSIGGT